MSESRVNVLAGFLKYAGLDRAMIVRRGVENRIRAQKLVYFGKALGLPLDYDFNIYLYGPYSSALARDYFGMGDEEWRDAHMDIPEEISAVLDELRSRDVLFLEIAATLHSLRNANPDASDESVIAAVSSLKADRLGEKHRTPDYVRETFVELRKMKLI